MIPVGFIGVVAKNIIAHCNSQFMREPRELQNITISLRSGEKILGQLLTAALQAYVCKFKPGLTQFGQDFTVGA